MCQRHEYDIMNGSVKKRATKQKMLMIETKLWWKEKEWEKHEKRKRVTKNRYTFVCLLLMTLYVCVVCVCLYGLCTYEGAKTVSGLGLSGSDNNTSRSAACKAATNVVKPKLLAVVGILLVSAGVVSAGPGRSVA